jgi:hypothetical protein
LQVREIMETANTADEYRRLEELYGEMSDSRLQDMADQVGDLTYLAQQVLRAEVSKRGLDKQAPDVSPEDDIPSDIGLTGIWRAKDPTKARSIIDILKSAGIPACMVPEKVEFTDGGFEDWVDIKVVQSDQGRAYELLRQYFPPEQESEERLEEDNEHVAVCPTCHSPEIVFQSLNIEPAPGAAAKYNWTCDACGYQWEDDGLEQFA